jgi:hypothetical protein
MGDGAGGADAQATLKIAVAATKAARMRRILRTPFVIGVPGVAESDPVSNHGGAAEQP